MFKNIPFVFFLIALIFIQANGQSVTVDPTIEYQTITGFGGFGPKKVWWDQGPWFDQEYLHQTIDNLGATIFRTQIYWDAEPENDNQDAHQIDWSKFDFGPESDNGKQFPFIRALGERGVKLIATVWTPPIWMKLYDDPNRRPDPLPAWCGDCMQVGGRLNPAHYDEFAEYLLAYVKKVKEATGVDIYAISIQNEPLFPNPFESNVMMPDEYADVLAVVGSRFEQEGLGTLFFGPEHMGEYFWVPGNKMYVDEILNDNTVKKHLDIYAVHSYVDGVAADYGSAQGWTNLYGNISLIHDKPLWMTETSDFDLEGFDLGFKMAKSLHLALKFGHISGWVYWYMAEAVIENNQLTSLGYAFKNYYHYILPGSKRIKAESSDDQVLVTAYKNQGRMTLVLINNATSKKEISLDFTGGKSPEHFYQFNTTDKLNCAFGGRRDNNYFSLPARSVVTLAYGIGAPTHLEQGELPGESNKIWYLPQQNQLFLTFSNSKYEKVKLEIYNANGSLLNSQQYQALPGQNQVTKKIYLDQSLYLVRLIRPGGAITEKLLVM